MIPCGITTWPEAIAVSVISICVTAIVLMFMMYKSIPRSK